MAILTNPSAATLLGHPCWYHPSIFKWAPIQDIWSVQQLGPSTFFEGATMKGLSAPLPGTLIFVSTTKIHDNNLFLLLETCILISFKEQMLEVSSMGVKWMPLQPHLPLSVSLPTPHSLLLHIAYAHSK